MFETIPVLPLAATFVASLLFGFMGAACVFKFASDMLIVAAAEGLKRLPDGEEHGRLWTWPRDRGKIVARSLAAATLGAASFGLSYVLAARVFHPGS